MYVFCYRGTDLEYIAFQYSESLINWSSKKMHDPRENIFYSKLFLQQMYTIFYLR